MKKLNFEDERVMSSEDNNCFAWCGKCTILTQTKLTDRDMQNCGTLNCDFYKPREHANSVKHVAAGGITFETREEFARRTGMSYLPIDDLRAYECFPHASPEEVDRAYMEYTRKMHSDRSIESYRSAIPDMSKNDLITTAARLGVKIDTRLKKDEIKDYLMDHVGSERVHA